MAPITNISKYIFYLSRFFILDVLENVFNEVPKIDQMLREQHFVIFRHFYKDIFQEVQDEKYT